MEEIKELLKVPNNKNLARAIEILSVLIDNVGKAKVELPDLEELKRNYEWLSNHVTKIIGEDIEGIRKDLDAIRKDLLDLFNRVNKLESKLNSLTKWKTKVNKILEGQQG